MHILELIVGCAQTHVTLKINSETQNYFQLVTQLYYLCFCQHTLRLAFQLF